MCRIAVVIAVLLGAVTVEADDELRNDYTKVTLYNRPNGGNVPHDGPGPSGLRLTTFREGRYNIDQLGDVGNDATESVLVNKGWRVQLFEHADFKGRSIMLDASRTDLGDFARLTSSLIVTRPGVPTVAAKRGRPCAAEGGQCSFLGPATVYYGAADKWVETKVPGPTVRCRTIEFGDPSVGSTKACFVADEQPAYPDKAGRKCADEGGRCARGPATIYYGAGDKWIAWKYELDVSCSAEALGDPNPGVTKSCYAEGEQPFLKSLPAKARKCADEGGECKSFGSEHGPRMWLGFLYYGAGDAWVKINPPIGVMKCNSQTFGGDPAPGIKKACFNSTE